jgi:Ca2+-binding EF-hand superfamily protein
MTSPLDFEHLKAELPEAFKLFDSDHDGYITFSDYASILRSMNINPKEAELTATKKTLTTEKIDLPTLEKLLSKNWRKPDTFSTLSNAFRVFDRQDKGFMLEEDIKKILTSLGEPFTTEEVNEFIRKSKPDTQSQIDYNKISLMVFNK